MPDHTKTRISTAITLLAAGAALLATAALAQPDAAASQRPTQPQPGDRRTVATGRINTPPVIDGVVDDECCPSAASTDSLIQYEPRHGEPSPHRTIIYIGFDDQALYAAFVCYDPDPAGIAAALTRRDSDLTNDDAVAIFLDSLNDGCTATGVLVHRIQTTCLQSECVHPPAFYFRNGAFLEGDPRRVPMHPTSLAEDGASTQTYSRSRRFAKLNNR
ncbi:MAG: hypothetical protein GTO51_09735 [Candidatus Latescibacteria bacterium]|nr:hypothetical protein [Candidatus Latescibacterota bacterium]NIM22210.1 hypothetical protein [Candidatus Latescibacterota bacterium]NIM66249.1 hypothetical protein [Candidatus Latescibacterota bacterium]NIO02326.1 hypothetical protein [Candidatus Latescibacterota bacterium]NIO29857.1 hypothetical protein [Candidatus Latescibacterota bacterium]